MAGIEDLTPAQLRAFHLGNELMKNPEIHRAGLRLAKKANPALVLPTEIELEDRIEAVNEAAKGREAKLEEQLMTERVTRRQEQRNREILEAGFTVAEIETIIVTEKCSYETAMKLAAAERRSAEPGPGEYRAGGNAQGAPIEIRPDQDFRKAGASGIGALRKLSSKIAGDMINGFRGRGTAR